MAVSVTCPGCANSMTVSEELLGKEIRCKSCKEMFVAMGVRVPAGAKGADERIQARAPAGAKPRTNGQTRPMATPAAKAGPTANKSRNSKFIIAGAALFLAMAGVTAWALIGRGEESTPTPGPQAKSVPAPIKLSEDVPQPTEVAEKQSAEKPKASETAKQPEKPKSRPAKFAQAPATLPFEISRQAVEHVKRSAVFISVDGASGSGWFAEPGIVITNAHVVGMKDPTAPPPKTLKITLNQGLADQRHLPGQLLGLDRDNDLAIIRVEADNLPDPIPIGPSAELVEGQKIYAIGFPYGHQKTFGRVSGDENIVTTVKSRQSVVAGRVPTNYGSIKYVQIEAGTDPGNSGSMVVDTGGFVRLIHVAGKGPQFYALKFSIPSEYAIYLLQGRILRVVPSQTYEQDGKVKQPLIAYVADPMKRIKRVSLDLWTGEPGKKIRAGGTTSPSPVQGDSPRITVDMNYDPNTVVPMGEAIEAKGECDLPPLKDKQVYWLQPHYVNPDGEERWGEAIALEMGGQPVQRKPAKLEQVYKVGDERRVELDSQIAYDAGQEGNSGKVDDSAVKVKLTENTLALEPGGGAKMRFKYNDVRMLDEERDQAMKSHMRGVLEAARGMTADAIVSKTGEIRTPTINLKKVPVPIRRFIEKFNLQTLQSYEALSLALPGREMKAGDTWKHKLNYAVVLSRDLTENSLFDLTYKYVGTRVRDGREEAVVEFEGAIVRTTQTDPVVSEEKPAKGGDQKDEAKLRPRGMSGRCRGAALLDLGTGIVSLARTDAEMQFEVALGEENYSFGATMRIDLRREVMPGLASGDPGRVLPNQELRLNPFVGSPDHHLTLSDTHRSSAGLSNWLRSRSVRLDQAAGTVNATVPRKAEGDQ